MTAAPITNRRPCVFCGYPTRSEWQVCAQHRPLLAEDYRHVRAMLEEMEATDQRSEAPCKQT